MGERIEVFWPLYNSFYPGTVSSITGGKHSIDYDDGDTECVDMANDEVWRFCNEHSTVQAATGSIVEIQSSEQADLVIMLDHFGNKPFLGHMAQGFPSYLLQNAFEAEQLEFKNTVRVVARDDVPSDANIISSHVIYKTKVSDDESLKLKARIAPHGNEDSMRYEMRSDCAMCAQMGVRMLL